MTLFPEVRRALDVPAGTPVWDPAHDIDAARAANLADAAAEPREAVAEVHDVDADGVPCRLYVPVAPREGTLLHLHGGGFVFHDVEVHDGAARRLANRTGLRVLSVDYRRPPEHRFPAAPDDVSTVVRWLEASDLPGPYAVHGDSAGGNLAVVAALRHPGVLAAVVLVYPFLEPRAGFASYELTGNGFDPREAAWYWQQYVDPERLETDLDDPDLAPLRATRDRLATLPPTLVVTAELDPLRDEGEELARRMAEAGVDVVSTRYQGQVHGFWRHHRVFAASEMVLAQTAAFLRVHAH